MRAPAERPRRSPGFYLRYALFLIVLVLVTLEVGLRILGRRPWEPTTQSFTVSPGGHMFQADSVLGFVGRPGSYRAQIGEEVKFSFTHGEDGFRVMPEPPTDSLLPEVWLLGCSFTHGYGVDDTATWAWHLARAFPTYRFRNFGMTAYGTLHSRLVLARALADTARYGRPRLVVLAYGDFHQQRNTADRYWRKALSGRAAADSLDYPYAIWRDSSQYDIGRTRLAYHPWPGQQYSAFIHWLEDGYNAREEQALHSRALTGTLIREIAGLSRAAGAHFLLSGIWEHPGTTDMLATMARAGIETSDWSLAADDPYVFLFDDPHPNAEGHAQIATRALPVLRDILADDKR